MCLLWALCVVKYRSMRLADHSSRGVLPSVVSLSVIVRPRQWGGPGLLGAVAPWKRSIIFVLYGSGNKSNRLFPYSTLIGWFCNLDGMCLLRGTKLFICRRNFVCRSTGTGFSEGTSVFACQYHYTDLRISLRLHAALTRRINGRILGTLHN
jgi:hypothetical protein